MLLTIQLAMMIGLVTAILWLLVAALALLRRRRLALQLNLAVTTLVAAANLDLLWQQRFLEDAVSVYYVASIAFALLGIVASLSALRGRRYVGIAGWLAVGPGIFTVWCPFFLCFL